MRLQGKHRAGRGPKGMKDLHVLSLSQHHLAKKTILALDTTLQLLEASLTDLDLSFAYMGYAGAQVLAEALGRLGCGLIRLGLKGNLLGDQGGALLITSLLHVCTTHTHAHANHSLTCLDLSSNCLGDQSASLLLSLPMPGVLHALDMRGNQVSCGLQEQLARRAEAAGSLLHIQWDAFRARSQHMR